MQSFNLKINVCHHSFAINFFFVEIQFKNIIHYYNMNMSFQSQDFKEKKNYKPKTSKLGNRENYNFKIYLYTNNSTIILNLNKYYIHLIYYIFIFNSTEMFENRKLIFSV